MSVRTSAMATTVAALALLAGCTYVKEQPGAEDVTLLDRERAEKCDKLGQTKVSVSTQVGFIARGESAIREDLQILARNSAADIDGDTVAPLSEISNGRQTYGIYDCLDN